jgi:hypothetical protein
MKTGHDLKGLIKFLGRDDWQHHLEAVVAEHFGPALDEFNLEYNEIGEVLDHYVGAFGQITAPSLRSASRRSDTFMARGGLLPSTHMAAAMPIAWP